MIAISTMPDLSQVQPFVKLCFVLFLPATQGLMNAPNDLFFSTAVRPDLNENMNKR